MFVAVSSYLMMWGDVVVDGIVLMCRYVVTCGGNVAVVWMMFVAGLVMLGDVVVHEVDCHVVDHGG